MARKRHEEENENHERWLVSYADFITLLFAFFVVMYALSTLNEGKYRVLSNSLVNAFGGISTVPGNKGDLPPVAPVLPRQVPARQRAAVRRDAETLRRESAQLAGVARDIQEVLAPLVRQGKVRVTQTSRGVSVEINASVLFASGDAKLTEETSQALRAVAAVLKDYGGQQFSSFKKALAEVATEKVGRIGAEAQRLMGDPAEIDRILADGSARARAVTEPVMAKVKDIVGFIRS